MHCPFCGTEETKVIDSRLVGEGAQVRRRRQCLNCNERFNTYETAELAMPKIIKNDGRRFPFDEAKLRIGFDKALEKRPVSTDDIENAVTRIKGKLRACGESEISSAKIGEWVMDELRNLDEVGYVRFASVYRSFQDVDAFEQEIKRLQRKTLTKKNKNNETI